MKFIHSAAVAASLLAIGVAAQRQGQTTPSPVVPTNTPTNNRNPQTTTQRGRSTTTSLPSPPVISGPAASSISIPNLTGSSVLGGGALTGLPTLTGAFQIVAPSVPPTMNAPFMQTSNLPEGTVFIAVGAILGFFAMSVLLWRALVAWALHRSVKRAAFHQNMSDSKTLFGSAPGPPAAFYKYADRESTLSLSGLGPKVKSRGRPSTSHANPAASTSNLFFSPTAGAAGAGLANPGNRASNYLPAGYYAAGAAAAGNGQSHVPIGAGHGPAISLSTLGPTGQNYSRSRSMGPSPPESPSFGASSGAHMASHSTLDLNRSYGPGERAPSAYLEDMFDGDAPPVPNHGHQRPNSTSPNRH